MIFVVYNCEQPMNYRRKYNGMTVSILDKLDRHLYQVGAYMPDGQWVEWDAHVSELEGFEGDV